MQNTPLSNRLHIGIFGRRNVGKSTLINALTGQETAIVSELPGTTTDPVYKAMEVHDIGPLVLIDTGGIDDEGIVGEKRVKKAFRVLDKSDMSLLVVDKETGLTEHDDRFLGEAKKRGIPVIVVINKTDISGKNGELAASLLARKMPVVEISALNRTGMAELREEIKETAPDDFERKIILKDLLSPQALVIIVAPLDIEAPKGRLKLPQVQTIRDILDADCTTMVVKEDALEATLANLKKRPGLVVTESQVFDKVAKILPRDIPMTSFSILYARYKGDLEAMVAGARALDSLTRDSRILIAEACTHHPIGDDIGRSVIPALLGKRLGCPPEDLKIDHISGYDFPDDLGGYGLVIHCGGCMLNRRDMTHRINVARESRTPITNYGILIAYCHGILGRSLEIFGIRPDRT